MWFSRLEHSFGGKIIVGATTCAVGEDGVLSPQPSPEDVEMYCKSLPAVFRFEAPSEMQQALEEVATEPKKKK